MIRPLEGVRLLDFTSTISGPYCGGLIADYGAEVIKIERPKTGEDARLFPPMLDGHALGFVSIGRSKKGVTLNMNDPEAQQIFRDLAAKSDVILENYTPGTMKRWNIDFDTIKAINPKIVYCSLSGFGQFGPMSALPGYDGVVQALSGMMYHSGFEDGAPTRTGSAMADYITGAHAAMGIAMGLFYSRMKGEAIHVDAAMMDCVCTMMDVPFLDWVNNGRVTPRHGNRLPYVTPFDAFQAKDGWIMIATANNNNFGALIKVMGQPELIEDPRFADNALRCANEKALKVIIEDWTKDYNVMELIPKLMAVNVPTSPIQPIGKMLDTPHMAARGMVQEITQPDGRKIKVPGVPLKFNGEFLTVKGCAPDPGQHNKEIFSSILGMSEAQIEEYEKKGVM